MKIMLIQVIWAVGFAWTGVTGAATLTEWGTAASAVSANCSALGCSKSDFLMFNPIVLGNQVGGVNQTSAELIDDVNPDGRGTVSAKVTLQDPLAVPLLQAQASAANDNSWVGGLAIGIQGYRYEGASPTTIRLDAALTGTVTNPRVSDVTGLGVGIWLVHKDPAFSFPSVATFNDLLLQTVMLPVADFLSWENQGALDGSTTTVDRSTTTTDPDDQLQITLNPSDEFYLLAALTAAADGTGAVADAFSTLRMEFDTNQLSAASVPLPASIWLLSSALVGLVVVSRPRIG